MRHLTSMELDDEDKIDFPTPIPMKKPDFPPNLTLTLTEREFSKLKDIDPADAVVEGLVHLFAMARIKRVSHETCDGKEKWCVSLQIEDLGFESEDEEREPDDD